MLLTPGGGLYRLLQSSIQDTSYMSDAYPRPRMGHLNSALNFSYPLTGEDLGGGGTPYFTLPG